MTYPLPSCGCPTDSQEEDIDGPPSAANSPRSPRSGGRSPVSSHTGRSGGRSSRSGTGANSKSSGKKWIKHIHKKHPCGFFGWFCVLEVLCPERLDVVLQVWQMADPQNFWDDSPEDAGTNHHVICACAEIWWVANPKILFFK